MVVQLQSVAFASPDPGRDAAFWAAILGRVATDDELGPLLAGDDGQVGLQFVIDREPGSRDAWLHLHLSEDIHGQAGWIAECERHGARLRGNGHVPDGSFAAMSDPVGDDFCVIEDGNAYLAGCGPLGEVTCEGTRAVGLFWSRALGWPLVWEQGEETAVQSPRGGTKVSWSGDVSAAPISGRQFFVVTVAGGERADEVDRLCGLGAAYLGHDALGVVLADPDGRRFLVRDTLTVDTPSH